MPKETLLRQPSFLMRHRRRRNVGAPVWLPLRRPKDVYRLARLWRLSSNSAMSSTFTFSPPCVPAMPSVIMFKQNGQAVATVRAPVASASCERKWETRCDGASSNHIRPPPAPQQKVFFPQRGISRYCASLVAPTTARVASTSPLTRARYHGSCKVIGSPLLLPLFNRPAPISSASSVEWCCTS